MKHWKVVLISFLLALVYVIAMILTGNYQFEQGFYASNKPLQAFEWIIIPWVVCYFIFSGVDYIIISMRKKNSDNPPSESESVNMSLFQLIIFNVTLSGFVVYLNDFFKVLKMPNLFNESLPVGLGYWIGSMIIPFICLMFLLWPLKRKKK